MKANRSDELVKVVAYGVTYGVRDEHVHTAIQGFAIRELTQEPDPIDARISIEFGPAVSNASATTALQMVLDTIETEGLPTLVVKMEKRAAHRLRRVVKLENDAAKASKLLTKLPKEMRADVKRMLALDI